MSDAVNGRRVVKLRKALLDEEGNEVTELHLRPGRFSDLKGLDVQVGAAAMSVPFSHLIAIASKMSGQTERVIGQLEGEDMGEVSRAALDFYVDSLGTGEKPSGSSPPD